MTDWMTTPPTREQVDEWQGTDERGWARMWEWERESSNTEDPEDTIGREVPLECLNECWSDDDRIRRVLVSPTGEIEPAHSPDAGNMVPNPGLERQLATLRAMIAGPGADDAATVAALEEIVRLLPGDGCLLERVRQLPRSDR